MGTETICRATMMRLCFRCFVRRLRDLRGTSGQPTELLAGPKMDEEEVTV